MSRSAKPAIAGVLVALLLGAAACGGSNDETSSSAAGTATQARETYEVKTAAFPAGGTMSLYLGVEKGIFDKHGVRVKFVPPPQTDGGSIPQLLNGQANVALGALTSIVTAQAKNVPVQAVAAMVRDYDRDGKTYYAAIVPKDSAIKRYRDLEGKTVGVNSLQGPWDTSVWEAVAKDGGDPDKVKMVAIGFPDQAAALRQGRVDAVMTLDPFVTMMTQQGNRSIGDPQAFALGDPQSVSDVAFMATKFIDENPEAAKAFVDAFTEAGEYAKAHPDQLRKVMSEKTGLPAQIVDNMPLPDYSTAIPSTYVERWNELLAKYGVIDQPVPVEKVVWSGAPSSS